MLSTWCPHRWQAEELGSNSPTVVIPEMMWPTLVRAWVLGKFQGCPSYVIMNAVRTRKVTFAQHRVERGAFSRSVNQSTHPWLTRGV